MINNVYKGINTSKYEQGIDDDVDERFINPLLRSDYRKLGQNKYVRKNIKYKAGLNHYNSINELTGKSSVIKGELTKTNLPSNLCNEAMSWQHVDNFEVNERTDKFLARMFKPENGEGFKDEFRKERGVIAENLNALTDLDSYDEYEVKLQSLKQRATNKAPESIVRSIDKSKQTPNALYIEPYRFAYDVENHTSIYKIVRAIRNLEREMDKLNNEFELINKRMNDLELSHESVIQRMYPIGSIYVCNGFSYPNELLGFGEWKRLNINVSVNDETNSDDNVVNDVKMYVRTS